MISAYLLFASAAGVVLPLEAGINAQLAGWLGSPVRAAFASRRRHGAASATRRGGLWVGGALGAFYLAAVVTAPKLGAATLIALVVAGQALASLLVDHFGWVGFEQQHISAGRIAGMILVAAGVTLVRFF